MFKTELTTPLRAISAALLLPFCAEAKISAQSYVDDGHLVFQLDGEENVGVGAEHDAEATTWANLVGDGGGTLGGVCSWEKSPLY